MEYLGLIVDRKGLHPTDHKVEAKINEKSIHAVTTHVRCRKRVLGSGQLSVKRH